jgi:hypothetical protein
LRIHIKYAIGQAIYSHVIIPTIMLSFDLVTKNKASITFTGQQQNHKHQKKPTTQAGTAKHCFIHTLSPSKYKRTAGLFGYKRITATESNYGQPRDSF